MSPVAVFCSHRCVLAASSPVLASILSSTGALVELQAQCLSGSVLALILDYIYTGTLPYSHSQQHYHRLLSAACHLQMDELQESLRAWKQTKVNEADKTNASTGTKDQSHTDLVSTHNTADSCSMYEETETVQSATCFLERKDHQYRASVDTCDVVQMHSASRDSCIKGRKRERVSTINAENRHNRADVCPLTDVSTCFSVSEHCAESHGNTGNWRQAANFAPQDLIQNIPCTAEVHKEVQRDHFHSAGNGKPETWQKKTEGDLVRTEEDRRNSGSSSPSSLYPCCGAVPVIRHSSRAAMPDLAEISTVLPYHPVSQLSANSSRATVSLSGSTKGIVTEHKNYYEAENQDYKRQQNHAGTQSWDYQNSSDQCSMKDLCHKSSTNQYDIVKLDHSRSGAGYIIKQTDECMDSGLSHNTDHSHHHGGHGDFFHDKNHTKCLQEELVPGFEIWGNFKREFKNKDELRFDDFPSNHQSLKWSECSDISMSTAAEDISQDLKTVRPHPVGDSDTGSDSHCEELCPKGDTKEEHSYSIRCQAELNRQHPCCKPEPWTDSYPKHQGAEIDRDTALGEERLNAGVCLPIPTTPESGSDVSCGLFAFERHLSQEQGKISDTEITEPQVTFAMPVDNMYDTAHSIAGQSYRGHLHYHCLPQEDTHFLHKDADHKHSHLRYPDYSDQSSDEEEAGTFSSPDHSSPRQNLTTTTDQVLLLDISAKPAELFVSYKHRSEEEEGGVASCKNDSFGKGAGNDDKQQRNEGTSAMGTNNRKIRARAKFGATSFNDGYIKSWVTGTNIGERKSAGKDETTARTDIMHKAEQVGEVSNHKEGESQTCTMTVCSPPHVPDTVQVSRSSTLSACIAPTLSASMPTNISAHLSTPLHQPFQCSLCERSFSQRGSLNRHVRSHLGVRPFPCPCCPMTFSRQYRVTEHMRVHQRCTLGSDFHKPPTTSS